jgi:hypothetical protein
MACSQVIFTFTFLLFLSRVESEVGIDWLVVVIAG